MESSLPSSDNQSMIQNLVSVVIPCFNSSQYVVAAVESVLVQTYRDIEIIVVDDGSTDDSGMRLKQFGNKIRYLYQSNRGVAAARNLGISEANGETIAFLDADDLWLPGKIESQMRLLRSNEQVGLVHCDFYFQDGKTGHRTQRASGWGTDFTGKCFDRLFRGNQVCVSSVMVRTSCLPRFPAFDEQITRPTAEDYDLWLNLARSTAFGFIDTPLVAYRKHEGNASKNLRAMLEAELYVVSKHTQQIPLPSLEIDQRMLRDRFFGMYLGLGYLEWQEGHFANAKSRFKKALIYRPFDLYVWLLRFACELPVGVVSALRATKKKINLSN
jgi:glycosyltransferase involved in cell wall biosynthesis